MRHVRAKLWNVYSDEAAAATKLLKGSCRRDALGR